MPAYDPEALLALYRVRRGERPTAYVSLAPGTTLAHAAAAYAEGALAFRRIAEAAGVIDPIPYPGPPPRAVRRLSLREGQDVPLPREGL